MTPSEPMEAKRCPTCGSDDPRVCESSGDAPHSHGRWLSGHGQGACCPDPFHDPPPAPVDEGERWTDSNGVEWPLMVRRTRFPVEIPLGCDYEVVPASSLDQALRERDAADKALKRLKEAIDRDALVPYNAGLTARAEAAEAQRDAAKNLLRETEAELADVERQREAAWFERDEAHAQRDRYREALERIAEKVAIIDNYFQSATGPDDHPLDDPVEGYRCARTALTDVGDLAHEALSNPTPPASSEEDTP